ncbi:MAG: hypothetical protein ACTH4U_17400 [Pseudoalteromonas prydzensis]|uniref:hypothetical protein n=1 Tax=Pseudoalteromonas prydzensis TaxID=182141 RepID=UPI003F999D7D
MTKDFSKSVKKQRFLASIPQDSLNNCDILTRAKFNFSYIDINPPGQDFVTWNNVAGNSKLVKLMNKLKDFTRQSLSYWENEKIGKGKRGGKGHRQSCLEVYKEFPQRSAFSHPPHVPEDVWWARFRVDNDTRLIGFIIPDTLEASIAEKFDYNTFYVVFLDENHQFYLTK